MFKKHVPQSLQFWAYRITELALTNKWVSFYNALYFAFYSLSPRYDITGKLGSPLRILSLTSKNGFKREFKASSKKNGFDRAIKVEGIALYQPFSHIR